MINIFPHRGVEIDVLTGVWDWAIINILGEGLDVGVRSDLVDAAVGAVLVSYAFDVLADVVINMFSDV